MPMKCLDTDLDAIFASSDFGEADGTVTFKGSIIEGVIFDDEDIQIELGEGVGEIANRAALTGPSRLFPDIADGDPVTVGADSYLVKNWIDDGTGVMEVLLEKQP